MAIRTQVNMQGLSSSQVVELRGQFGSNLLPQAPSPSILGVVVRQFTNPLCVVLVIAGGVSLLMGGADEAIMIGLVLGINSVLGSVQELRAEKGAQALQQLLRVKARVMRDGNLQEIEAEELVPGDLVLLESGDRVPADLRLEWCHGLEVNESFLTGESLPVSKDSKSEGDRLRAYAASTVVRGRARGVVESTGYQTAVGRLAKDVTLQTGGASPLQIRMQRFTRLVAMATLLVVVAVGLLGYFVHQYTLVDTFLFSVALAVSAIPEGLPIALTVALSVAASRMARHGVIVRRLESVEGLGSCTLIASDKTGTLTMNQLMVTRARSLSGLHLAIEGAGFEPHGEVHSQGLDQEAQIREELAWVALLCNEASLRQVEGQWVGTGDPLEVALLALGAKLGQDREELLERLEEAHSIPFEAELKYSATIRRDGEQLWTGVKGAPEAVLNLCPGANRQGWLQLAEEMAAEGLRVLLMATGRSDHAQFGAGEFELRDLLPLALVGMVDPLRPEALDAVQACRQAGIQVLMVTGDHRVTALTISRQLGLASTLDQVIEGDALDDPEEALKRVRVFSRTAPDQKLKIVQAAQKMGHFVAVTGDGVNDAPALRAANIGVAMGRSGTDVAREAADLVITDDNFATLIAGVKEGRIAYNNVRKVIFLLVSTGAAEVAMVVLTFVIGLPVPLLPSQLLWLNLVTNGIQDVALAFEPGEGDELSRPPRDPKERVFDQLMLERVLVSVLVMGGAGVALFTWLLAGGASLEAARNQLLLLFVLFEIVQIGNCRSEKRSALVIPPWTNPLLIGSSIVALGLHLVALVHPLGHRFLYTESIAPGRLGQLALISVSVLLVIEVQKWSWRRRQAR